jgi:hypothetical protein
VTTKQDPEAKRLRKLTDGALADEVGTLEGSASMRYPSAERLA